MTCWYLSSAMRNRLRMRDIRTTLMERGHTVCSHWIDLENEDGLLDSELSNADIRDLHYCTGFLMLNSEGRHNGRLVELGYFMGLNHGKRRPVYVLGKEPSNVFLSADGVTVFRDFDECLLLGNV
jgi:hypothetical protein